MDSVGPKCTTRPTAWSTAISADLTDRISEALGHPPTCPHGLPIPGNYPETDIGNLFKLSDAEVGSKVRVVRLSEPAEDDTNLLRYFEDKQLVPGRVIEVAEHTPSRHIVVHIDDQPAVVDDTVAANLWVIAA